MLKKVIQVVKFGMMGDYLPVDVSDADLHIIRCLSAQHSKELQNK